MSTPPPRPAPAGWHRRLRELPTSAQDTLLAVAAAAMSLAPLLPHMPLWAAGLGAALLGWRALLAWRHRALPARWLLALLLAAGVGGTLARYHSVFGRDPGIALLGMLLGLKLLETRGRRDAYVVFYLGLFCVFAQFLYTQSALAAAWMLACLLAWLTALLDANLPRARPPLLRRLGMSARLLGLGLPVMLLLFVLFPRLSGPLWSLPDTQQRLSGLSSSMDPGSIARLALDDSVAFRVRFLGRTPPQAAMYWRGPVLERFDGSHWREAARDAGAPAAASRRLTSRAAPVRYTLIQQPTQQDFVFALDAPAAAPALSGQPGTSVRLLPDLQLRASRALTEVTRIDATSWLRYAYGADEPAARLRELRELPAGIDPRSIALGRELRQRDGARGATAVADAALRMFREQPFRYSLHPGVYEGADAIDEFLFQRRVGFCEHYAQAFVVLMRAAGIPARIVTGYQGGSRNPIDGLWVVRQSDAHAWAEYWVDGEGWVRADPTAMVDPARVERGDQTLGAREPLLGVAVLGPRDLRAWRWMRDAADALDQGWNQWVLDYGEQRQQRLLRALGMPHTDAAQLASASLLGVSALLGLGGLGGLWLLFRQRAGADPWRSAYALLQRRLRRLGIDSSPAEPPARLAQRVQALPGAQPLCECLLRLEQARYALPGADPRRLRELRRLAARVALPHRPGPRAVGDTADRETPNAA